MFAGNCQTRVSDPAWFVPVADAVSVAATELSSGNALAEVTDAGVSTDWAYAGETGVDEAGEYFDQERSRQEVEFARTGGELSMRLVWVVGERRHYAGGKVESWRESEEPADPGPLAAQLTRLETQHLTNVVARGNPKGLLDDFARAVPPEYTVADRGATTVVITKVSNKTREKPNRGWSASWDARLTLSAAVDPEQGVVTVTSVLEHRFSTESSEGSWERAGVQNSAAATDWLASTLRIALPAKHASFGAALLDPVAALRATFTPAPAPPRLRTIREVEEIVRLRAFEQRRGDFTVCIDHVIVNPKDGSGYDWDLPGVSDMLEATQDLASTGEEVMGELNAAADRQPLIGALADGGMAYLTGDAIDRKQVQSLLAATAGLASWTTKHLPAKPDIAGGIVVGGQQAPLPEAEDTLRLDPHVCDDVRFRPGFDVAAVELWDVDLQENDFIGRCSISPDEIVDLGLTGIPCGFARVYASAQHRFSLAQVKLLGLPPAE